MEYPCVDEIHAGGDALGVLLNLLLNEVNVAPLCSGISIPASVTDISEGQLSGINNMVDRKHWTVTISPGNTVYRVGDGGKIERR